MTLDQEIERFCEGCERRRVSRLIVVQIPTVRPVKQNLCTDCEMFLSTIGIRVKRKLLCNSLNRGKVKQ